MRFSSVVTLLASAGVVLAANVSVLVGDNSQLAFSPTSVTISSGDTINFEFRSKNHTVTQSTFANPCQLVTTPPGIDSGFQPVAPGATSFPTWSITIENATAPLWFFCAQTRPASHCAAGMVFAVNPNANKTFEAFQANAKASGASATTSAAGGGGYGSPHPTGSGSASGTAPAATTKASNGAVRTSSGAAGLLTVAGLFVGLML